MKNAIARKNAIRRSIAIAISAVYWLSTTTSSAITPMMRKPRSVGLSARKFFMSGGHERTDCQNGRQQGSRREPSQPLPRFGRCIEPGPGHGEDGKAPVHVVLALGRPAVIGQQEQADSGLADD